MLVLFSQLKKYLPDLTDNVREVCDVFTMTGSMLDKFHEVTYQGKPDYLLDLEIRQNRADCYGVQGLARELSAYYDIPLIITKPGVNTAAFSNMLPIEVLAKDAVKRVMGVRLNNLNITESPVWLKEYLALYGINSVSNIVDLTNYVMLETGHPSHAFDIDKSGEGLVWEINPNYKKMISLDGSIIDLVPEALVVSDGKKPLALAGIVGGVDAKVDANSKNILLEMAVYDGGLIRRNARQMKVMTEASSRLEKFMDPDSIPDAFNWLINLIFEHCGGEFGSAIYENYLSKREVKDIAVDLAKVSEIAGIEVTRDESITYIKRLGLEIVNQKENLVTVKRPVNRLDIDIEEDVFEEILRMKGFYNFPSDKLSLTIAKDVTPSHLKLIDRTKEILINNGFDEVRSWVLVDSTSNKQANSDNWEEILVTNSINEEVPALRQSISVSLLGQLMQLKKNYVPDIQIFEEGKVFGKANSQYEEYYHLGLLLEGNKLNELKNLLEVLLRSLSIDAIVYKIAEQPPEIAHPKTCFSIIIEDGKNEVVVGNIFVTNEHLVQSATIVEVNINSIDKVIHSLQSANSTKEISSKLVSLDTNILIEESEDIADHVEALLAKYSSNIWKWEVADQYIQEQQTKYTVRVVYMDLGDEEAKKLHDKIFG